MNKEKQSLSPGTHVGFITLLMIVLVVCLAIFISLTFRSVNIDHALTDRTGDTVVSHYAAHNQYQEFLSELDALLIDVEALNNAEIHEHIAPLLNESISYDESTGIINACWVSGERLVLQAKVLINTSGKGVRYSVVSVETVTNPQGNN